MVKYADNAGKPRIRECFESIPKQLAKDNNKFQYSVVRKGGRSSQYIGSIQWLEDAGIAKRCYNTQITELPLEGNSIKDCFKLYTTDIGLLVAMLDYGTQADILKGNLTVSFKAMMYRCPLIGRDGTIPLDNVVADKIVVNVIGGGTFDDGTKSRTISNVPYSEFQTQTLTIKGATADTQIEFTSPSDVPSTRWFIDDICVSKAE